MYQIYILVMYCGREGGGRREEGGGNGGRNEEERRKIKGREEAYTGDALQTQSLLIY